MSPRLIRNLIDVPERVSRGDFVLKLSEGVTRPEETVRLYHVTPALRRDFDDALSLIRAALEGGSSKAAYLDGSFGAGKSHFMAVLLLLLQGHAAARSREELHPVLRKHPWGEGRRFLLVPYHMIGAPSMEAGVLGGYVEQVRRLHPGCPVPGVFVAEGIFDNARELRASLGDERFFARLSEAAPGDDDWGDLGEAWDAGRFEQALAAPPGDELRHRLVGDLVATHFTAYKTVADQEGEGYVGLDEGLSVISRHAKELGYDALILFLDELVLWLATRSADLPFIQREGVKLPKLVEAQRPRHLPVVSFVARQRDLRELIGRNAPGAQAASFYDAVQWAEERFGRIVLEDRDLPEIVQARVLAPRSDAARAEIDAAFERTAAAREEVMRVLTTDEGDRAMFRRVYPFSPALVDALVAISSVLQRERTALKVLVELLVEQRDTLELDQVVPVGDLWDVVAHGDEPFSDVMRSSFEQAKKLYHQRLRSFPTNSLHVAGITDPSPLPALRRKTGTSKYRHLRRALAAGRLGAPARSGICREALKREIVALARQLPPEELEAGGAAALAADSGPFGSLPSTPASGVQGSLSHADTFPSDEMGILDTEALVQVASGGKRWRLVGLVAAAVALLALAGWLLAGRSAPQDASAASEQPGADSAESVTAETTPRWIRSPPRLPRPRRPRLRSRRLRLPRHPRVRRRVQASRRSGRSARSAHAASPAGRGSSQVPQAEEGIR